MTLVIIGPVTNDLVVIGEEKSYKVGGATYFQSFVFEKFYTDYLAIVNCSDENLIADFPDLDKVNLILKNDTHFFINDYPDENNLDYRQQLSNFADIPILKSDLEEILRDVNVEGFVLNPLNRFDFPLETIEYIKSFDVPIFLSIQGFLRLPGDEVCGNYAIKLDYFDMLSEVLCGVKSIFLDEIEANIIGLDFDVDEIVVTNGSQGSRIISDDEIRVDAVKCEKVVDTTGCGDTFMAAYVSKRLKSESIMQSGKFASKIASEKIANFGHY